MYVKRGLYPDYIHQRNALPKEILRTTLDPLEFTFYFSCLSNASDNKKDTLYYPAVKYLTLSRCEVVSMFASSPMIELEQQQLGYSISK